MLIADRHANTQGDLEPLVEVVGKPFGEIAGLFAPVTDEHPHPERVSWAEALRVSLDQKNGALWLQLDPDIWIWPPRARRDATEFLSRRRGDRLNAKYNALLDAWIRVILGTDERGVEVAVSAFKGEKSPGNPNFVLGSRTAYSWRLVA